MTSEKAQIQSLIDEIDEVLRTSKPRFPWGRSKTTSQQRQVLEQTRGYLSTLKQQLLEDQLGRPERGGLSGALRTNDSIESAQQVLQAVLQEMNYLRVNMLQPMRSEVESLQHQRQMLLQEIHQLQSQKQQSLPPQGVSQQFLVEFLQSAMGQLQQTLTQQVQQMMVQIAGQAPLQNLPGTLPGTDLPNLPPAQSNLQAPNLQAPDPRIMQQQSDHLMMRLDSTLRIIFESLQKNIQSYQDSLEQGLHRMHGLGQQGEAMFSTMVTRLAEQLGREASTYLQASVPSEPSNLPTELGGLSHAVPEQFEAIEIDDLLDELNSMDARRADVWSAQPVSEESDWQPLDLPESDLAAFNRLPQAPAQYPSQQQVKQQAQPLSAEQVLLEGNLRNEFLDGDDFFLSAEEVRQLQVDEELLDIPSIAPDDQLESTLDFLTELNAQEDLPEDLLEVDPVGSSSAPKSAPDASAESRLASRNESRDEIDPAIADEFYQDLFGRAGDVDADAVTEIEPENPFDHSWVELSADEVLGDDLIGEEGILTDVILTDATNGVLAADWFSGIQDPAAASEVEEMAGVDTLEAIAHYPAAADPQSVETFLMADSPKAESLDDAVEEADLPAFMDDNEDLLESDRFELASPDENLLNQNQDANLDPDFGFELGREALDQLQGDLAQLESPEDLFFDDSISRQLADVNTLDLSDETELSGEVIPESGSDKSGSDKSGSDESGSDKSGSDESGSDKSGSDKSGSDKSGSDKSGSDESGSDENSLDNWFSAIGDPLGELVTDGTLDLEESNLVEGSAQSSAQLSAQSTVQSSAQSTEESVSQLFANVPVQPIVTSETTDFFSADWENSWSDRNDLNEFAPDEFAPDEFAPDEWEEIIPLETRSSEVSIAPLQDEPDPSNSVMDPFAAAHDLSADIVLGDLFGSEPDARTDSQLDLSPLPPESALSESALSESALSESALSESALSESALSESALSESALEDRVESSGAERSDSSFAPLSTDSVLDSFDDGSEEDDAEDLPEDTPGNSSLDSPGDLFAAPPPSDAAARKPQQDSHSEQVEESVESVESEFKGFGKSRKKKANKLRPDSGHGFTRDPKS